MRYKAKSCHDCIFDASCDNPNKTHDGSYRCSNWEWKYQ